jgi:type II secretory pathway pseudopilin PulG
MKRLRLQNGFSLIELTVILVAIGIALAVVMQSMTASMGDIRRAETEREMEQLADAIVGNAEQTANGARSNLGYVGDVGTFPSSLNALRTNVGSRPTWDGPYLLIEHSQDTLSYLLDAWGTAYSYSGGNTITSTGSGSNIIKKIANNTADYLRNTVTGTVTDIAGAAPGAVKYDSVKILIDVPSGASGTVVKSYKPNSSGQFTLDSIPAGIRRIRAVYTPANDTAQLYYPVMPHHKNAPGVSIKFARQHFYANTPGSCTAGSVVLRPNGDGAILEIASASGCASHYLCVNETSADADATYLYEAGSNFQTEVFTLTDTVVSSCTISSVVVTCRARHVSTSGSIRLKLYVGAAEFTSTTTSITGSYANYSYTWNTNPATGGDWTWPDIANIQAGCELKENGSGEFRLTQVYVTVNYGP